MLKLRWILLLMLIIFTISLSACNDYESYYEFTGCIWDDINDCNIGIYMEIDPLMVVERDGKFGAVNENGEEIIKAKYSYLGFFKDGMCAVFDESGMQGFINKNGELVIPMEWVVMSHDAPAFNNGSVILWKDMPNGETKGFRYFKDGDILLEAKWQSAEEFGDCFEDYAFVRYNELWGVVDEKGNYVVVPQFYSISKECTIFKNSKVAIVFDGNKYGLIIKKNKSDYKYKPSERWLNFDHNCSKK